MSKKYLLTAIVIFLFCLSGWSQKANTDSLGLVAKISENQLKLAKLQNSVGKKTKEKRDAAYQAENSADANITAAEKLSNDPEDKTLARKASNKASDAKSDARKARKDAARLDNLNENIQSLEEKIASEQHKLNRYIPIKTVAPEQPILTQQDTTRHQ
jgi:hypothetical protein